MPLVYERDDARRRVVATVTGPFQAADVFDMLHRQRDDGTWTYGLVFDTFGMTEPPTIAELRLIIKLDAQNDPEQRSRGPLAILASNPVLYGMACVYAALGGSKRQVEVFRNREEAHTWLTAKILL